MAIALLTPKVDFLPRYIAALERHWTPDGDNDRDGAARQLARIQRDPDAFLASLVNPEGRGDPIVLEDGTSVPRLPFVRFWIADGDYVGDLNLRWQRGTSELPPYVLGHIGYAVVPWKRSAGYASAAIRLVMPYARKLGLARLDISMDASNLASRRTAEKAGADLIKIFNAGPEYGDVAACLYRLGLD